MEHLYLIYAIIASTCLQIFAERLLPKECCTVLTHGLSQDLETGCPNRGFIDFWVSKVWYKVRTTNEINHIYLQILLVYASNCLKFVL